MRTVALKMKMKCSDPIQRQPSLLTVISLEEERDWNDDAAIRRANIDEISFVITNITTRRGTMLPSQIDNHFF